MPKSAPLPEGISNLDYHVLLAMAQEPLYGYAIKDAVERESAGALAPRAGSLYRVLARLMSTRLVVEVAAPDGASPHPGRERKYYSLTATGRAVLDSEARRLGAAAALAMERLRMLEGRQ